MTKDDTLRDTFDADAELYHASRPHYPAELFEVLIDTTKLDKTAHLLEIGIGTGQATKPLAKEGYKITAIELGKNLANVAQRELVKYPNVKIIQGAFEDIDLPANSFDLIYAATTFHWIKPDVQFSKPHKLLKQDGYLAVIHTEHVSDEAGDVSVEASQPIYDKYTPKNTDGKFTLPTIDNLEPTKIDDSLFELIIFKVFPLTIKYSAKEYTNLLLTYSPTIALPTDKQNGFLNDMHDLIESQFNDSISKSFAMTLTIARKKVW